MSATLNIEVAKIKLNATTYVLHSMYPPIKSSSKESVYCIYNEEHNTQNELHISGEVQDGKYLEIDNLAFTTRSTTHRLGSPAIYKLEIDGNLNKKIVKDPDHLIVSTSWQIKGIAHHLFGKSVTRTRISHKTSASNLNGKNFNDNYRVLLTRFMHTTELSSTLHQLEDKEDVIYDHLITLFKENNTT